MTPGLPNLVGQSITSSQPVRGFTVGEAEGNSVGAAVGIPVSVGTVGAAVVGDTDGD